LYQSLTETNPTEHLMTLFKKLLTIFRRGTTNDDVAMVTIETPETTYLAEVTDVDIRHRDRSSYERDYPDEIILETDSELTDVGWPK
jgi:hypothetical protein